MEFGKEKIYTIPVNDAFQEDSECPFCAMERKLEEDAIAFTLGPSYMEDDVRAMTDEAGFCKPHMRMLLAQENKLGLALMLSTHLKKTNKDIKALQKHSPKASGLFKKNEESPLEAYLDKVGNSCFICRRIEGFLEKFFDTVFYMWKSDPVFRDNFKNCKGFCMEHYSRLLKTADKRLRGKELEEFCQLAGELYIRNMERVEEDVNWFINKFDYRYKDEPWKNAKDAIPRAVTKVNSILDKQ
ncbi:DUF6062 family protein [Lachnotalea sp. AF33-28]|jgi:hypothetical protein|uniref:DUF6062 family protein n=1 Tax=Lachnotalea sp. AF33-28 TaxID=2292046 RepID=UPI000E49A78B|nr:DUF6062 family protein [Lachnotalea sp. AF33-28]RHP35431.1 hypothetical protein DWZ56_02710 [Lachnotalea sp. AF33-28]